MKGWERERITAEGNENDGKKTQFIFPLIAETENDAASEIN